MKEFKLPEHTSLEEDLNNPQLLAQYKAHISNIQEQDDIRAGRIDKSEAQAKNRVNQLINFDNKNINEQIAKIEKTDEFVNYDEKGKDIVEEWCKRQTNCITIKRSKKDSKAVWDILIQLNGEKLLTEIKMRNKHHQQYPDWYLQEDKYNKIMDLSTKYNYKPVYCNLFTDDQMLMWDMNIVKNKITQQQLMNKTKMGDNIKINKEVYGLKNNEAFLITNIK
jgi:hypothetical protein